MTGTELLTVILVCFILVNTKVAIGYLIQVRMRERKRREDYDLTERPDSVVSKVDEAKR